jgi:gas vesicle protein
MIRRPWRLLLGVAIGVGMGYAAVLLLRPAARRSRRRLRTVYRADEPHRETEPVA